MKGLEEKVNSNYELIVIGNTNVGKSTFLNSVTKMKGFFNSSNVRETSCVWRFKIVSDSKQEANFVMRVLTVKPKKKAGTSSVTTKGGAAGSTTTGGNDDDDDDEVKVTVTKPKEFSDINDIVNEIKSKSMLKEAEALNPQDLSAEELALRSKLPDDIQKESNIDDYKTEVEVSIRESFALYENLTDPKNKKEKYRVISKNMQIVDIPGIEDGQQSVPIMAYIEKNKARVIPVILINLTQGDFDALKQF